MAAFQHLGCAKKMEPRHSSRSSTQLAPDGMAKAQLDATLPKAEVEPKLQQIEAPGAVVASALGGGGDRSSAWSILTTEEGHPL